VAAAFDLVEAVAEGLEEVVISGDHLAGRGEFDHRLGAGDGVHQALEFHGGQLGGGDVGRHFHHLGHAALAIAHRIVGGLEPDLLAALAQALVLAGVEFAAAKPVPEGLVVGALRIGWIDELPVMAAFDLIKAETHDAQKIGVGGEHLAARIELDDGERSIEGLQNAVSRGGGSKHIDPFGFAWMGECLSKPRQISLKWE
jgi:hypothetical protein